MVPMRMHEMMNFQMMSQDMDMMDDYEDANFVFALILVTSV